MFVIDKIFNLKIDTKNKNISTVTGFKQFDNNSMLNITMLQNNLALDLSNCTVRINFLREDNKVLLYMANIASAKEGKVSIKLSPQVLEKVGTVQVDISVFDSNLLKITSATFNLRVEKSIYNDTYFTNKDLDLMQQEYVREKERQANEINRIQSETKRNTDENTRNSNEEARKKAESTRVSEWNNAKKDANNIKNTLDTTIDAANKTKDNLQNTITTGDKLKQELTPQNYVKNTDYQAYKKQVDDTLKENTTKNITKETNVLSLTDNIEGIANISLSGNTIDIVKDPIISNFKGKIQGNTSGNPNIFKIEFGTSLLSPDNGGFEEKAQDEYNKIYSLDDSCAHSGINVNGKFPQMLFSFNIVKIIEQKIGTIQGNDTQEKVAWLKKNTKSITCNWWGYGRSPNGNKAYLKNHDNGKYGVYTCEHSSNTVSKLTYKASNLNLYDLSDGFMYFTVYTDASNGTVGSNIYTDYINLEVQLNPILRSVGEENKEIVVKSIGKNLFNGIYENKFIDATTHTIISSNATRTTFVRIDKNKTYYIKKHSTSDRFSIGLFNSKEDNTLSLKPLIVNTNEMEYTITNDVGAKYLAIYVSNSNEEPKLQVEEGTQATEYEPYQEDKVTINLLEPLKGLPNGTRDTINSDGSNTIRVNKVVLNGSENGWSSKNGATFSSSGWAQFDNSLIFALEINTSIMQNFAKNKTIYSNLTIDDVSNKNVEGIIYQFGTGWQYLAIRVNKSKLSTQDVQGFKKWLSENPVTVYYESNLILIGDKSSALALKTFKNGSIIIDTEVAPFITVNYPSNINSRINTVEDATSSIKNSLGGAWQTLLILADKELKMRSISKLTTTDALSNKINEIIGVW